MARSGMPGAGESGRSPLSPLIHGQVRLLVLATLFRAPRAHTFTGLRDNLHLTDGSLSANLSALEKAGLITIEKTFAGKRPQTLVRLSTQGRTAFRKYLRDLRRILPLD